MDIKAEIKKLADELDELTKQETELSFRIKVRKAQLKKWYALEQSIADKVEEIKATEK